MATDNKQTLPATEAGKEPVTATVKPPATSSSAEKKPEVYVFPTGKALELIEKKVKYFEGFIGKRFHNPHFQLHTLANIKLIITDPDYAKDRTAVLMAKLEAIKEERPIAPGMEKQWKAHQEFEAKAAAAAKE